MFTCDRRFQFSGFPDFAGVVETFPRDGREEVVNFVEVECLGNDGRGAEGGFGVPRDFVHCGFCNFAVHEAQGGGDVGDVKIFFYPRNVSGCLPFS